MSFLETGRSRPGAEMVDRLGEALAVPLRERNLLMEAAGLRPRIAETPLGAPAMGPFRESLTRLLSQHAPFPAMVIDRHFDVVEANEPARAMLGPGPDTINVVELTYAGAWRETIVNWEQVAWDGMKRIREAQVRHPSDARIAELAELITKAVAELSSPPDLNSEPVLCPHFRFGDQVIRTLSVTAHFGSTRDVTLEELQAELIYPRDEVAERFFREGPPTP